MSSLIRTRSLCLGAVLLTLAGLLAAGAAPAVAQTTDDRLEELERQVEELRSELERRDGADREPADADLAELEARLEALAAELERLRIGEAAAEATESEYGFGPAASKIYRTEQGLSIGGYGEMLYETFDTRDDGSPGDTDELDFLRGILYFGYKFDDRWLFNSEIEFEHASTGKSGEASVEFAYLDYLHRPELNARTGLLLVPMGFVNELHEPTVFLGARRPVTETVIIPSTWRESGVGLFGDLGPVSYRTYVVNGLDGGGFSSGGLRGGRQKGSKAIAEDFAWVGRLDWSPVPGLTLGGSAYVGDSGQDLSDAAGPIPVGTTILEGHGEWRYRGLELRALYARAELDDVARLNGALGRTGAASVGEELTGYYLQVGYDLFTAFGRAGEAQLIPYVRWEEVDTQAAVPAGFAFDPARDTENLTLGVAWQPIDEVIVKVDYQDFDNAAGSGQDQFNVALGYIF